MTGYDWDCYLKEDMVYETAVYTLTTAGVQVAKLKPMRRILILPANATSALVYVPGDSPSGNYTLWAPLQDGSYILTWDMIGCLVTYPWWGFTNAGSQGLIQVVEMSANPQRWAQYQRYLHAQLAELGTL